MVIGRVYIILHKLDMTKGDMDVFGLQNVILPVFSSQLSSMVRSQYTGNQEMIN